MNKEQILENMAKEASISKAAAKRALESFMEAVTMSLKKGDKVALTGFGSLTVSKRKARTGRNPQTGESLQIPAKTVALFKAGKGLTEAIN